MTKETNKYSFETWWEPKKERMKERKFRNWLIKALEHVAREAWNESKAMANEEILESNVVINRGIYDLLMRNKDKTPIREWNFEDEQV